MKNSKFVQGFLFVALVTCGFPGCAANHFEKEIPTPADTTPTPTPTPTPVPSPTDTTKKATIYTTTLSGYSLTKTNTSIYPASSDVAETVKLTPSVTYQKMDGFGAAITYSTAYNLLKMTQEDRTKFLEATYSDKNGYGFSYVRVSIGCSDFSSKEYTCCDTRGLENFALTTDETDYVIPILKEILAINPNVKIIGSPWTCPRWMKVKDLSKMEAYNSWTDGHLNPQYYAAYAAYFMKWIRAFEAAGVNIYAVTPQNEPLNHGNCASTYMPWDEEAKFVKTLAATFKRNKVNTKIYVFDHNYNYDNVSSQQDYPIKVYDALGNAEGAEYVVGAAYHNYGGSNVELDDIHQQKPDKGLIFSEASIGTWNNGRDLSKALLRDMEDIALGTVNRWCSAVIVWNLMLDMQRGPNLDGGCQTCYGAVDIDKDYKTIHMNSHYYVIAHLAAVVKPDALRIGLSGTPLSASGLSSAAFLNPDGSFGAVFCNNSDSQRVLAISDGTNQFSCYLPARSVVSCKW